MERSAGGILLDTHIWLWLLLGDRALPAVLRRRIERSPERCCVSPVSAWEVGLLNRRGRVPLKMSTRAWVELASDTFPAREAALTTDVAVLSQELTMHEDPGDRLLAATAVVNGLTLATLDQRLIALDWLPTLSG